MLLRGEVSEGLQTKVKLRVVVPSVFIHCLIRKY